MSIEVLIAICGFAFSTLSNAVSVTWVLGKINARTAETRNRCDRLEREIERQQERLAVAIEHEASRSFASESDRSKALAAISERLTTLWAQVHEIRNKITPRILAADVETGAALNELRERVTRLEARVDSMSQWMARIEGRSSRDGS